jgi:putative tryptophan/tyrosine transport system substrate-binding protein
MRRREVIAVLAGAAAARPLDVMAQQERVRRIGVLMGSRENHPEAQARFAAIREGLRSAGWLQGRNLELLASWGDEPEALQAGAAMLLRAAPEVIVVQTTQALSALRAQGETIPIVFTDVGDPVASGFVSSLARPGGMVTGFTSFESTIFQKWLELLREVVPALGRVLVLVSAVNPRAAVHRRAAEAAAQALGVRLSIPDVQAEGDIRRAFEVFTPGADRGVLVMPGPWLSGRTDVVVGLAVKDRLPAIFPSPWQARSGGLLSYGPDVVHLFRQAASYVDRILRGEKPAELPVQQPTKFELVVNLRTAKAIGLTIPESFLLRADEVIE